MFRALAKYLPRHVARFGAAQEGTTIVEFALVAPAFLALLFAIIETTLFLFAQATLQNAAIEAGRLLMTGQVQNAGTTQSDFKNNTVCPMLTALFTCSNLQVDVANYSSFSSAVTSAPTLYNSSGNLLTTGTYSLGTQGDVMVIQLVYPWQIFGIPLGSILPDTGHGTAEIMGVSAFKVEPY